MPSRNPWHVAVAGGLAWVAAVLVRWQHLPVTSALLDATGPFLSAARSTLLPPPQAAIYGGALAWPHRLVLAGASSLWDAVAAVHALHALVAPLAVWALFRMGARPLACGAGA